MNYQISQMPFSYEVLLSLNLQSKTFCLWSEKAEQLVMWSCVEITTFLKSTIFVGVVLL